MHAADAHALPLAPRKIAAFCAGSWFSPDRKESNHRSHNGLTDGRARPCVDRILIWTPLTASMKCQRLTSLLRARVMAPALRPSTTESVSGSAPRAYGASGRSAKAGRLFDGNEGKVISRNPCRRQSRCPRLTAWPRAADPSTKAVMGGL